MVIYPVEIYRKSPYSNICSIRRRKKKKKIAKTDVSHVAGDTTDRGCRVFKISYDAIVYLLL